MASEFSDDFNRSNSDSLGSDWNEHTGDIDIASNVANTQGLEAPYNWSEARATTALSDVEHYAEADFVGDGGVFVRANSALDTYYVIQFKIANNQLYIYRFNSGSIDVVTSGAACVASDGDTCRVEITTESTYVEIKSYVNDVLKNTTQDNHVNRLTTGDYAGIWARSTTSTHDNYDSGTLGVDTSVKDLLGTGIIPFAR